MSPRSRIALAVMIVSASDAPRLTGNAPSDVNSHDITRPKKISCLAT